MTNILNDFIELGFSLSLAANAALFIPQIIKLHKLKDSREVSLWTFVGFNIVQIFTGLHAYNVGDQKMLIGMIASFILCFWVNVLIIYYGKRTKKE